MKESLLWLLILAPYGYLATMYSSLPDSVPTHFNLDGVADGWSSKTMLLYFPALIGVGIYVLMLIVPLIDTKKQLQYMGEKYYYIRLVLTVFMSVLTFYILYSVNAGMIATPKILFGLIGLMFAVIGNYFQVMRPNYFIGIRTPWTLESESVWRKTHRLGGRVWLIGGILIVISVLLFNNLNVLKSFFIVIVVIISLIPVIYSYIAFQQEKKLSN